MLTRETASIIDSREIFTSGHCGSLETSTVVSQSMNHTSETSTVEKASPIKCGQMPIVSNPSSSSLFLRTMTAPSTTVVSDFGMVSQTSVSLEDKEADTAVCAITPGTNVLKSNENHGESSTPTTHHCRASAEKSPGPTISTRGRRSLAGKCNESIAPIKRRKTLARKSKEESNISTTCNNGAATSSITHDDSVRKANFMNPKVVLEPLKDVKQKSEQTQRQSNKSSIILNILKQSPVTTSNKKELSKRTSKCGKSKVCFTLLLLRKIIP